jgi:hypothetical protein
MAFKSMVEYNNERYSNFFILRNDGDSAEVIPLFQSSNDAMTVACHYIKSDNYSGYVQCLGPQTCPACKRNIRVENKFFIPLYDIDSQKIVFWDRSTRFFQQFDMAVFSKVGNPSEFVFRITRRGAAGDRNTRYDIVPVYRNNLISYDEILKKFDVSFPDYYNTVCPEWSLSEFDKNLSPASSNTNVDLANMPEYKISPRGIIGSDESSQPDLPDFTSEEAEGESDGNSDDVANPISEEDIDNVSF